MNPDGTTPHPLFCTVPADGRESSPFYFSPFNPKRRDLVPLKTYGCVFPEHKTLYLVRLSDSGGNWEELELIMTGRELPAGIPLAHTSHEKPARLDAILKHLFAAVEDAAALPQLTPEAKEVIMNYLNEENVHGQET